MTTSLIRGLFLGAAILFVSSVPGWASSTVNVTLTGDAGDKMGVTLDTTAVPAGIVKFVVKNGADVTDHEMVVVKLKTKGEMMPMMEGKHRVDEDKLMSMGEVSELQPGASGEMSAQLGEGDYFLLCNLKSHYEAGMFATFTVTK